MIAVTFALPGSTRTLSAIARNAAEAARILRRFARSRGVSPLAVDWSARLVARAGA